MLFVSCTHRKYSRLTSGIWDLSVAGQVIAGGLIEFISEVGIFSLAESISPDVGLLVEILPGLSVVIFERVMVVVVDVVASALVVRLSQDKYLLISEPFGVCGLTQTSRVTPDGAHGIVNNDFGIFQSERSVFFQLLKRNTSER